MNVTELSAAVAALAAVIGIAVTIFGNRNSIKADAFKNQLEIRLQRLKDDLQLDKLREGIELACVKVFEDKMGFALQRFEKSLIEELRKIFVERAVYGLELDGLRKEIEALRHSSKRQSELIAICLDKAVGGKEQHIHIDASGNIRDDRET